MRMRCFICTVCSPGMCSTCRCCAIRRPAEAAGFLQGFAKAAGKVLPYSQRQIMKGIKEAGQALFAPERGGSLEIFKKRPMTQVLQKYCAQDVVHLFPMYEAWCACIPEKTLRLVSEMRMLTRIRSKVVETGPQLARVDFEFPGESKKRTLEETLLVHFNELYFDGHDSPDRAKLISAVAHFRLGPLTKRVILPRVQRALTGWQCPILWLLSEHEARSEDCDGSLLLDSPESVWMERVLGRLVDGRDAEGPLLAPGMPSGPMAFQQAPVALELEPHRPAGAAPMLTNVGEFGDINNWGFWEADRSLQRHATGGRVFSGSGNWSRALRRGLASCLLPRVFELGVEREPALGDLSRRGAMLGHRLAQFSFSFFLERALRGAPAAIENPATS
ncbi:unnamed protein product [Prorocentrum cordatum]|uniref:Uncharacterized protein n=1 Tax=Prorocentrum cordatum TaxID=2364126 RepID=A0ABN9SQP2_9DINO|nr:unnamed protein product [Polarella glacialis]